MPEYEWQHYLPEVYLKQFSATRKADIWRLDEQVSAPKSVRSQCAAVDFYSSTDREGTEKMFQQMEDAYGRIVQKVKSRKASTKKDYFGLILFMLQLHCRNIVYDNRTGKERAHASNVCEALLLKLMGDPNELLSYETFLERWRVRIFQTMDQHELVTSDNPVTFFSLENSGQVHLVTMPITPFLCAAAFDIRIFRADGSHLSMNDELALNCYQVKQCHECLYTMTELSPEQQLNIRQRMKDRVKPFGYVGETESENELQPNVIKLPRLDAFSFLSQASAGGSC